MLPKNKRKIAKALSLVVLIAGFVVMFGWILDISVLKSISPAWSAMKFDTAIAFVLSGITLYFVARTFEGDIDMAQVILSITTLIIVLLMGIIFFSTLLGVGVGIENLFIKESAGGVKTIAPGRPSLPTMVNFLLVALAGIFTLANSEKLQLKLKIIGYAVGTIGALAIIGYILNVPVLYYYITGINSAMACNTAVLFVLLGIGLLCLSE